MVGARLLNLGYPLDLPKSAREDRNYARCRRRFATLGAIIRACLVVVVLLSWALPRFPLAPIFTLCACLESPYNESAFVGRVTVWSWTGGLCFARGGTSAKSSQC